MTISKLTIFISLICSSQIALAEVYKCKTSSGKTIYSESPCASGTSGSQIDLNSNRIDSSALRNRISKEKSLAANNNYQSEGAVNNLPERNMTTYDRQTRISELLIDMSDINASYEKKADAKNEYSYLLNNDVRSLSYEDELKRRNLKIDLNSPDNLKCSNALRLLSEIYLKYKLS